VKNEFKDALDQTVIIGENHNLFLNLEILFEDDCFYEIGLASEDEINDGSALFYGSGDPGSTETYFSEDEVKKYLSHCISMTPILNKIYGKEDASELSDSVFLKETDMTYILIRLVKNFLGKKRNLIKTKDKKYQWVIKNVK
jgi:hypothetical protein